MRQSRLIGKTIKETPKDAHSVSHQLLLRAGYMQQIAAGVYAYKPLLLRVLNKITGIIREELNTRGCSELLMPALQPRELWEESGRWERYTKVDGIMFSFLDRRDAKVCLGPTHEEVITAILRNEIDSYKDLPLIAYQIQSKFRDEIRPRFGLMRAREFIMKDAYSFDIDPSGLDTSYNLMREAYHAIFSSIGFNYRAVEADSGAIGGSGSQEFMVLAETGEDLILYCNSCDYAANQERAGSILEEFEQDSEPSVMEEVLGEGIVGVDILAKFLNIPVWKTTKTLLYDADDQTVAVMVRGDCDVNEIKLQNYLNADSVKLCSAEKVKELTGAEIGYAGPINLPETVKIIADGFCDNRVNFECGANRTNYHNINVNFDRDLARPSFGDFKLAKAGHMCPHCKEGKLSEARGIEVGHIFKLGTKYSEAMECLVSDSTGQSIATQMGCYGIGISRIAAAAIEQSHDDKGIIWPEKIAPFSVHLIGLNLEKDDIRKQADELYRELANAGIEVLYDDRSLRAGEKFADADLIGIPIRITASARNLKNQMLELKTRDNKINELIQKVEVVEQIKKLFSSC